MSEEELNQELSTDELKDVAGGPSIIDNTRASHLSSVRNIIVNDDLKKEESFSKRDNSTTKYNRQDF